MKVFKCKAYVRLKSNREPESSFCFWEIVNLEITATKCEPQIHLNEGKILSTRCFESVYNRLHSVQFIPENDLSQERAQNIQ